MDDSIKNAFQKVKQDIETLTHELSDLKYSAIQNEDRLSKIDNLLGDLIKRFSNQIIPTNHINYPTDHHPLPANPTPFKPLKDQFPSFSIGNRGVPADRQTNQQTNQQTEEASFDKAVKILGSLDNLRAEVKSKFKKITEQEFLVFSSIYQLEEEIGYVEYKTLSLHLNLTESSIRDYVGKLIKKGIPIEKKRINNKVIHLFISENLKKIAPLSSFLQLRDL